MLDPTSLPERATQQQLAEWLDISPATLRTWHDKGTAPPKVKIGKRVYYRRDQVAIWLEGLERVAVG